MVLLKSSRDTCLEKKASFLIHAVLQLPGIPQLTLTLEADADEWGQARVSFLVALWLLHCKHLPF